jgi:predicted O-methyltransferase YrrM
MNRVWQAARLIAKALWNVGRGANLASLRFLLEPRRFVEYTSEALFLEGAVRPGRGGRGLQERYVTEILPLRGEETAVPIRLDPTTSPWWFGPVTSYLADLTALTMICRLLQARTVFEIGTLEGHTSYHLALNTPDDATIWTLDLPTDGAESGAGGTLPTTTIDEHLITRAARRNYVFPGKAVAHKIKPIFGDSATFDYGQWRGGKVDFFFVDGAHSYEYVANDTAKALDCTRIGGVIAWHDFGRSGVNGVTRFLRELAAKGYPIYAVPGGSLAYMVVPDRPLPR